jgi:hypothetical protein
MIPAICRTLVLGGAIAALAAVGPHGRQQAPASAKPAAESFTFDRYHPPQELNAALTALNQANPTLTAVHRLARSAGGRDVLVLEIGPEAGKKVHRLPAVFVVGNLEGTVPVASEAAVFLARQVVEKAEARKDLTWYILAAGNPDAAARFFAKPLVADGRNDAACNDDMDEATDEDGPDDLDGNGLVTEMRARDPAGEWIPVEGDPRMMRRADPAKGEKGIYKLYTEGIDNDGDGDYNEDGPGGTDISVTFPHLFRPFAPNGGAWPGSEAETFAVMQFVMGHPEIAMTFTLGTTNMCLQPPAGGRQGSADLSKIKLPERYAKAFGADPNATYTVQEIMDMVRPMVPPGFELTESIVASFLGLGAVVNPLDEDLKYYKEISERYKEFLKQAKLDGKRLEPPQPKDGSFELWSYYHLGVPTFSMDCWTLPEAAEDKAEKSGITAETLEGMTSDAFLALGEAKIAAFLKEVGAPDTIKATMLIEGVKSGKMTPKMMAGMLKQMPKPKDTSLGDPKMKALLAFSDKMLQGKGFVPWKTFTHPTLGEVEIGGAVAYADSTPPPAMIKSLIEGQVPFALKLASKLPRVKFLKTDVTAKGANIYELTVWVQNAGELPFPTAMGKRNQHVGPIVVTVGGNGLTFLSGRRRSTINDLDATKSVKLTWLVQSEKPQTLPLTLESPNAWSDTAEVRLGGVR